MSSSQEPEKYSIDEMMDRLKQRQSPTQDADGELVTRADGSQAVRVRKRKRRSHQPHKEAAKRKTRMRAIQIALLLTLSLLSVAAIGIGVIYGNSAPFREALLKKLSASAGANVELTQFRLNPSAAVAGKASILWPEPSTLKSLSARGVAADFSLSSIFGNSFTGDEITAEEAELVIGSIAPATTNEPIQFPELAHSVRFNRYASQKFHASFNHEGATLLRLVAAEASFFPVHAKGYPQLLISRGDLLIPTWPKLRLERSHLEFHSDGIDVVTIRIRQEDDTKGLMELNGMVLPKQTEKPSALAVRLESFPLSGIAGASLGKVFNGRVDTVPTPKSNEFLLTLGSSPSANLLVTFRTSLASPFEVSNLPFLTSLAQALNDISYEKPVFESEASGALRRTDGTVILSDLWFENKSRIAIKGSITAYPDNRISGDIRLGLPESVIKTARDSSVDAVFGPLQENYRWVSLRISGTSQSPKDDFLDLLKAAKNNPAPIAPGEVPSFEELTSPE
jgi:hypothetical protein